MEQDKIVYEKHPVSKERKAELRRKGYRILDERFKPQGYEYPEDLRPEKPQKVENMRVDDPNNETTEDQRREYLFAEIERLDGKRPGANSKTENLEAKLAELKKTEE
ncbi:hypothetical protein [Vreelandella populi]|uniref:hypothetical protein n=1 Tax=Vreelandella populi TaxID=2498858 RepID=UPI000F8F5722|nr:hypothetical protein [Halomonas populi]RUR38546.1 hypothetical protein ELY25_09290 [Halomonas populi]